MTELLAPSGDFKIALKALYSGADAIYLATERFGARAYAKNVSLSELEVIIKIAHQINKKVYVTVNTLIKDEELIDCYNYLDTLAKLHVDGIISADFAIINYIINTLPTIECHISTQVGVKNIDDIKFFEEIKAHRTVLARETSIDEIKEIKKLSKMPIEVFIHGALCVSYSGNCYLSSLLTLRSGNRGRCSQNCRFDYTLFENDKIVSKKCNLLSMKDLNSFDIVNKLADLNVDSLKIEGRMKDEDYVTNIVSAYRAKLDNKLYKTDVLNKVFHREYTKGYIANEDNGSIVYSKRSGNVGDLLGEIKYLNNYIYKLNLKTELLLNQRIRIYDGIKDYYFNVNNLLDINKQPSSKVKIGYLVLKEEIKNAKEIYLIKDLKTNYDLTKYFNNLDIYIYGNLGEALKLTCLTNDKNITLETKGILTKAQNKPLDYNVIYDKLNHFDIYPYKIRTLEINLDNLFINIKEINDLRKELINKLLEENRKFYKHDYIKEKLHFTNIKNEIICKCYTKDQYLAAKELGIKTIFYQDNILSYLDGKKSDKDNLLIKSYGALFNNKDKDLTLDYEFNVFNSDSLYEFNKLNIKHITVSKELSYNEILNLCNNYTNKYGSKPNLDYIVYGRQTLMTTKYCVLKHEGLCPNCKKYQYYLADNFAKFPLIHTNCLTHIINDKPLYLIDEIYNLKDYISRFRLDFTLESKEETKTIILKALRALDAKTNTFDPNKYTRGYFKRKVL